MQYKHNGSHFFIRIIRGEGIIEQLKSLCRKEKINGGFFYGIGAVDRVELAHYNVSSQKYSSLKFTQPLELTSLIGSIGVEKELIVHAHAVLGNAKMETITGHLVEARVSGTAEIFLLKSGRLNKKLDPETGLKLFWWC